MRTERISRAASVRLAALLLVTLAGIAGCGLYMQRQVEEVRTLTAANQCAKAEEVLPGALRRYSDTRDPDAVSLKASLYPESVTISPVDRFQGAV